MSFDDLNRENFTPEFQEYVFDLFKSIEKSEIEYIYRGRITSDTVVYTLELAKYNLEHTVDVSPLRHRIYFIMGEGLQNITKHQDNPIQPELQDNSLIIITKIEDRYRIVTANVIRNNNIESLKEKLDHINDLTLPELKLLAREIRKNTVLDNNSNASIGLVEIAKRSGSTLLYTFKKIDDLYSYFYLSIEINVHDILKSETLRKQDIRHLTEVVDFHNFLNDINVKLIFKGDFSQDNIILLLEMLKHQISEGTTAIKVHNIMVEMLQNIEKHGDNLNGIKEWKPGFFMINYLNGKFYLTSANYISNEKIEPLQDKLVRLNHMNKQELSDYYKKILLQIETITSQKSGLGFIDIRRRSGKPLNFVFLPVDEKISLFIFQAIV